MRIPPKSSRSRLLDTCATSFNRASGHVTQSTARVRNDTRQLSGLLLRIRRCREIKRGGNDNQSSQERFQHGLFFQFEMASQLTLDRVALFLRFNLPILGPLGARIRLQSLPFNNEAHPKG